VAERFFDHYPAPSAVCLRYKARGAKPGDCHAEKAICDGEVEKIVTCCACCLIQLRLRASCPTSRTSEHSRAGARRCDVRMFGCLPLDGPHREGGLLAALRTYLPLSRTTLTQQFFGSAPQIFGDPAQRHRRFCASSSRAVRGKWYALAEARGRVVYPLHLTPPLRCCPAPTGRIGNGVGYGPKKAFGERQRSPLEGGCHAVECAE
jgi:hypothetical protein